MEYMGAANGKIEGFQYVQMGADTGSNSEFFLQIVISNGERSQIFPFAYVVYIVFNVFVLLTLEPDK